MKHVDWHRRTRGPGSAPIRAPIRALAWALALTLVPLAGPASAEIMMDATVGGKRAAFVVYDTKTGKSQRFARKNVGGGDFYWKELDGLPENPLGLVGEADYRFDVYWDGHIERYLVYDTRTGKSVRFKREEVDGDWYWERLDGLPPDPLGLGPGASYRMKAYSGGKAEKFLIYDTQSGRSARFKRVQRDGRWTWEKLEGLPTTPVFYKGWPSQPEWQPNWDRGYP
jgi:hypothetical protein